MSRLLIRGAKQLLTLRGSSQPRRGPEMNQLGVIEDGAVLIENDKILEVGPARRVESLAAARNADVLEAHGRVVMPGLIDTHMALGETPLAQRRAPDYHIRKMVQNCRRHGTTTVGAYSGTGEDPARDLKSLRLLASFDRGAVDIVRTYLGAPTALLSGTHDDKLWAECLCDEVFPSIRRRFLADFVDLSPLLARLPIAEYARCVDAAHSAGLSIRLRSDGACTPQEVMMAQASRAATLHGVHEIETEAVQRLARFRQLVTLLPAAAFWSGESCSVVARTLIDHGVPVVLASGFDADRLPVYSMPLVMGLAVLRGGLTPAEAISAATINAAHALSRSTEIGSIEHGKLADLLILEVSDYRDLVRHLGANLVVTALKRGVIQSSSPAAPWTKN